MDDLYYYKIIFLGLKRHRKYLAEHFKREQLKAEEQYVGADEFKNRLLDLVRSINLESRFWIFMHDVGDGSTVTHETLLGPGGLDKLGDLRLEDSHIMKINSEYQSSHDEFIDLMYNNHIVVEAIIKAFDLRLNKDAFDLPEIEENIKDPNNLLIDRSSGSLEADKKFQHDPNLWNLKCYKLFIYLFDNYFKGKKRELTNIWFYLKAYDPKNYTLIATKDEYKDFIKKYCGQTIKNFDKASIKYIDKDLPNMDAHRIRFEEINNESLKSFE